MKTATVRNPYHTVYLQNFGPKEIPIYNKSVRIRQHGLSYRIEQFISGPIEGDHWQMLSEHPRFADAKFMYFGHATGQHWEINNEI